MQLAKIISNKAFVIYSFLHTNLKSEVSVKYNREKKKTKKKTGVSYEGTHYKKIVTGKG